MSFDFFAHFLHGFGRNAKKNDFSISYAFKKLRIVVWNVNSVDKMSGFLKALEKCPPHFSVMSDYCDMHIVFQTSKNSGNDFVIAIGLSNAVFIPFKLSRFKLITILWSP